MDFKKRTSKEALTERVICCCNQKSIKEAVEIFENTTLPYKKAKKLVTECNKNCCRKALMSLFDMVKSQELDYAKIVALIDEIEESV